MRSALVGGLFRNAEEGTRSTLRAAALLLSFFFLSACGFQPMYGAPRGEPSAAVAGMAETRIALIPDRAGQELRNNLLDRMTPYGQPAKPRYELQVSLGERLDRLGIARDDTATYGRITLTANFTLREIESGRIVHTGQSRWSNGFTMVSSHFANLTSEQAARSRGLQEVGEDIRQKLGLYFTKPAT